MGFFKKVLSDVVGDNVADLLTGETAKSIARNIGIGAAKGSMNSIAEKASKAAVKKATDNAARALNRQSSLETPPPPAVPQFQTLSVMVAVNGQTYGPYERATLIDMIAQGTLTPDTYVFIQGMAGWEKASDVNEVATLFAPTTQIPSAPPAPFANASKETAEPTTNDNTLSPRLNRLITAAVADGEISDLERQVLIRNAQEENVPMDEFVMVLEARLYDQRRALTAKEEEKKAREKELQVKQMAALKPSVAPAAANAPLTKCPHCGAPIKAFATSCPECGCDYPVASRPSISAWEKLETRINEIQREKEPKRRFWQDEPQSKNEKIVIAIQSCGVPSTKQELVEFFTSCAPLGKPSGFFNNKSVEEKDIEKAYYAKAQQVLLKARIVMKDDPALLQEIETIAVKYKIKA